MTEAKLTIGHIAQAAGVNVETVRYYQRRGLVNLPPKRARGFRYYTPETASRVRFIKRAQALGMSLKERTARSRPRNLSSLRRSCWT